MNVSGWQYKREDGVIVGILSDDEMKHCAERGGLSKATLVMHADKTNGKWVEVIHVNGLRERIESVETEKARAAAAEPISVYIPPKPTWRERMKPLGKSLMAVATGATHAVRTVSDVFGKASGNTVCSKCQGEFTRYSTPGQCPLCGEWVLIACGGCGYRAGARSFAENKCTCPRCGTKARIPGIHAHSWGTAMLAATLLVIVLLSIIGIVAL